MALKLTGGIGELLNTGGNQTSVYIISLVGTGYKIDLDGPNTLCKGAELPGLKVNTTDIWWKGVKYPVKREKQHNQSIDLTFYQDKNDDTRAKFMKWMSLPFSDSPSDVALYITQGNKNTTGSNPFGSDFNMDEVATYKLQNVFPTNVSDIKLAYDKAGEIAEYTVTFSYSIF